MTTSLEVRNSRGKLFVETSCMRGGKTERLISVAKRLEHSAHRITVFTNSTNQRDGQEVVASNGDLTFPAKRVETTKPEEILEIIEQQDKKQYVDVVGIDEGNFYDYRLITTVQKLRADKRRIVLVTGLNWTFRGEPFEVMERLIAIADEVNTHQPYCQIANPDGRQCENLATNSVRILRRGKENLPSNIPLTYFETNQGREEGFVYAPYWHPTIQVEERQGENVRYTVACPHHFQIPRKEETQAVERTIEEMPKGILTTRLKEIFPDYNDLEQIVTFLTTERRIRKQGEKLKPQIYTRDTDSGMYVPKP